MAYIDDTRLKSVGYLRARTLRPARNSNVSKYLIRIYTASFLLLVTPLGFMCKFYSGPGHWWCNNYGAGLLYEIFWILLLFFLFPTRKSANGIPVCVFIITSVLEFVQLSHPWFLEEIRSYFLGRVLIGTTFTWWDFPHYAIGCVIGWLAIRKMATSSLNSSKG